MNLPPAEIQLLENAVELAKTLDAHNALPVRLWIALDAIARRDPSTEEVVNRIRLALLNEFKAQKRCRQIARQVPQFAAPFLIAALIFYPRAVMPIFWVSGGIWVGARVCATQESRS